MKIYMAHKNFHIKMHYVLTVTDAHRLMQALSLGLTS